jgi:transposase
LSKETTMGEDDDVEAKELREQLATIERRGRGRPYPPELRARVASYLVKRRAAGATLVGVGTELGMSWRTVERWSSPKPRASRATSLVRPVAIRAPPTPSAVVVHGPRGVRIEGLDVASLAELIARLG